MDRLVSCYFCGTALEEPLDEYPVVPDELRPSVEHQQTIVLCQSCRRKLTPVVDRVVEAATGHGSLSSVGGAGGPESADSTTLDEGSPPDTGGEPDPTRDPTTPGTRDGPTAEGAQADADDAADTARDPGTERREAPEASEATEADGTDQRVEEPSSADSTAGPAEAEDGNPTDTESGADTDDSGDEIEPLPFVEDPIPGADDSGAGTSAGSDTVTAGATGATEGTPEQAGDGRRTDHAQASESVSEPGSSAPESDPADDGDQSSESASDASKAGSGMAASDLREEGPSLTALEYNQVIRLLQNREFPLDREEIELLASSAYDIDRTECAAVIDLAIDQNVLREEDGQLYRSSGN